MSNDRESQGLRGPVESVQVEHATFEKRDGRWVEQPPWSRETVTFGRDGRMLERSHHSWDGSEWVTHYHYSESGKLLASTRTSAGDRLSEMRYDYDEAGRLIAERSVDPEGRETTKTTYVYDEAGRKTRIQDLGELPGDGGAFTSIDVEDMNVLFELESSRRIETTYDERGGAVEVKTFDAEGAITRRVAITRDERGNALEETVYAWNLVPLDSLAVLTPEQRAEALAEIERTFPPGEPLSTTRYRYDEQGRLESQNTAVLGEERHRQTFAYDEHGNKSEIIYDRTGARKLRATFTREYDEHGNWTRELVSGESQPSQVTRRTLRYY